MTNLNVKEEKDATLNPNIDRPVLLITAMRDPVAIPAMMESWIQPFVSNLQVHSVDAGHWIQIAAKDEVNNRLELFFSEVDN
jgi:pimeloyl-ACP methyl ester carboxylesterase